MVITTWDYKSLTREEEIEGGDCSNTGERDTFGLTSKIIRVTHSSARKEWGHMLAGHCFVCLHFLFRINAMIQEYRSVNKTCTVTMLGTTKEVWTRGQVNKKSSTTSNSGRSTFFFPGTYPHFFLWFSGCSQGCNWCYATFRWAYERTHPHLGSSQLTTSDIGMCAKEALWDFQQW